MFRAQLRSGGFHRERSAICHDRACEFARPRRILRDGRLVASSLGRNVADFLPGRAHMTEAEAGRMLEVPSALPAGAR